MFVSSWKAGPYCKPALWRASYTATESLPSGRRASESQSVVAVSVSAANTCLLNGRVRDLCGDVEKKEAGRKVGAYLGTVALTRCASVDRCAMSDLLLFSAFWFGRRGRVGGRAEQRKGRKERSVGGVTRAFSAPAEERATREASACSGDVPSGKT